MLANQDSHQAVLHETQMLPEQMEFLKTEQKDFHVFGQKRKGNFYVCVCVCFSKCNCTGLNVQIIQLKKIKKLKILMLKIDILFFLL